MATCLVAAIVGAVMVAAPAQAARNVYIAENFNGDVSQYAIGTGGLLAPLVPPMVDAPAGPASIQVAPNGTNAYVMAGLGLGSPPEVVGQFGIDPTAGALTPGPTFPVPGGSPADLAIGPGGDTAYVTADPPSATTPGTVAQYAITASGALAPLSPATVPTGLGPLGVAVAPDGDSAYVTNFAGDTISQYAVSASGALSPLSPGTVTSPEGPSTLAVAPDGESLYVVNNPGGAGGQSVSQYAIDPASGALSTPPVTLPVRGMPSAIAVTPDGGNVYVIANPGEVGVINQFGVDASGTLAPLSPATVPTGGFPSGVATAADGESVYVASSELFRVFQYDVDALGRLTEKDPSDVRTGPQPLGVAGSPAQPPTAAFSDVVGTAGRPTSFDAAASTDPDGTIVNYSWDFGDGNVLDNGGVAPSHTYARPGTYSVELTVTDDQGCSTRLLYTGHSAACNGSARARTSQTVTVGAAPPPRPTCSNRSLDVDDNTPTPVALTCSGTISSFSVRGGPDHGSLGPIDQRAGEVTYTADPGYSGPDAFAFGAANASGSSNTATATLNVLPLPPVCPDRSVNAAQDEPRVLRLGCTGNVDAYTIATGPRHGRLGPVRVSTGTVTYTPARRFTGRDSFTFVASDSGGRSRLATVMITVRRGVARASILSRSAKVRSGAAPVWLACSTRYAARCRGSLLLRATTRGAFTGATAVVGRSGFSIAAGRRARLNVALTAAGRRLLRRRGALRTTGLARTIQPSGAVLTSRRTIVLR